MPQWVKAITDYNFSGIKPFVQYKDIDAIQEWCECLNAYIANGLDKFWAKFKENITLTDKNVGAYSFYYLRYYFGMFSGAIDLGTYIQNFYDSGYIKYEGTDDEGQTYKYDSVSADNTGGMVGVLDFYPIIAAIAAWSLDRRHEVLNIPAIADLLKRINTAFGYDELDLNTIKFVDTSRNLVVQLPNESRWRFISRLSAYDLLFFNLPICNSVKFEVIT